MTTIEQNVKAREAANTLVELGITLGKDEGLDPEQVRHMWKCVLEIVVELIGLEVQVTSPGMSTVQEQWSTTSASPDTGLDEEPFPFGKYGPEGECLSYGDVPDSYYEWLSEQHWIDKWPDILAYIDENGLD